ncbi:hypothetical protein D1007_51337 [Hordeum vulgare]|nr:hypothetical protein D1007_51337 [Hordeum vulgare]
MAGGSSSKKTSSQGAWLGSEICEGHIEALRHHQRLPPASQVLVRIPDAKTAPTPAEGEIVVFDEHLYMGFGLPASPLFFEWLHFFGLQPHHLAPNAILQLSAFLVLCEGFLGIEPRLNLWRSLFFFKQQSIAMDKAALEKHIGPRPMTPCGAALEHHRSESGFPQLPLQESIKQWQRGLFYVKNADPARDALNMPPFNISPSAKLNSGAKFPKPITEVAQIGAHLDILEKSGLLGRDLLTTMVTRKIMPLQRRPHLVCQMSGRHDPCRTSTKRFTPSAVALGVNHICTARMDDSGNWSWGMIPYCRARPPPVVSTLCCFVFAVCLATGRLAEPAVNSFAQLFEKLEATLNPPASYMATSDASEIEDEGMIESRSASSEGSENTLESEGTKPSGEHLRPSIVDWTDDDKTPSSLSDATFEEDSDGVEEVTSPPLTRGRRHRAKATGPDEAARKKGKGATASRLAPKGPTTGPPAGARASGAKKRCGGGRRQVPIRRGVRVLLPSFILSCVKLRSSKTSLGRETEDVEEDTASTAERAGWTATDAAQRELEAESKRRRDATAGKTTEVQSRPNQAEKPTEKRTKARHDPSMRARVEELASEAAPRRAPRTEVAQPSEPEASAPVDLEVIPDSPRAEAAPNARELILDAPDAAPDAPGVNMDAPDVAHPPPAKEAAPAGMSVEPAAMQAPGDGTIVVPHHGPVAPGAGARVGSRPMKTLRAANLARSKLPAGATLHGVPGAGVDDLYDAQVQAYNMLRAQNQTTDGQVAELQARIGEVVVERDTLCGTGGRLQEQLTLLQTEKKELEAASRAELE